MRTAISDLNELDPDHPAAGVLGLAERGLLPDFLIRFGIRRLCARRLREEREGGLGNQEERLAERLAQLRRSPVAIHSEAANAQHYELPAEFFALCLGPRMKYSCSYYAKGDETLETAEADMLRLYCARAGLADGQDILELGCGWGSLTLWMAERYPAARITAVSNSSGQRRYIEALCRERGLANVRVLTRDVSHLTLADSQFDRCVSVEMFEHLRNYETVMSRIAGWLRPGGKLFVHLFAHRTLMYPFETAGVDNWMGRHFFTGGQMPAADTLLHFQRHLRIERRWLLDGAHYAKTANHWLERQDRHRGEVLAVLRRRYGDSAVLWFNRWRLFWMACAELFGYAKGSEWLIAHYLCERAPPVNTPDGLTT
jgi:cyclopropane-fatty-acyl-phospholipid synthase